MAPASLELLQQMPIFGGVKPPALEVLLGSGRRVEVPAGSYFFREQEPAQGLYVLEAGRVVVVKQWRNQSMQLRVLEPGDCFGEMALLDLFPRSASVRALDASRAFEITAADLLRLFEHDMEQFALVQMNIAREMCRRLRETDEMLFEAVMGGQAPTTDTNFQAL